MTSEILEKVIIIGYQFHNRRNHINCQYLRSIEEECTSNQRYDKFFHYFMPLSYLQQPACCKKLLNTCLRSYVVTILLLFSCNGRSYFFLPINRVFDNSTSIEFPLLCILSFIPLLVYNYLMKIKLHRPVALIFFVCLFFLCFFFYLFPDQFII